MSQFFSRIFFPPGNPAAALKSGNDSASPRVRILFLLSLALTVVIFVFDITTSFQTMVCTVPYVFLVLACLWMPAGYFPAAIGGVSVLVILGFINTLSHHSLWQELAFNRLFCLIGIWVTAIFCQMYRQSQKEHQALHIQLMHSEKLSSVGKLSASIAHEFNNPIYGVRNALELIREEAQMDEDLKGLAKMAVKECDRMASLVAKLRDFYSPSSDFPVPMDIHEAIDDMVSLNKNRWRAQGILVARAYAPNMPKIEAIPDQIKQVILNLLQNAEEALSSTKGGEITITTKVFPEIIEVQIQDTGAGIAPGIIGSVFQPFFTTKSAIKGTGLGLSVTYGIIKKHGGDIRVDSQPGKGTTIAFTLPIKYSEMLGGGG